MFWDFFLYSSHLWTTSSLASAICLHFSGVNYAMCVFLYTHINRSCSQKHQVLNLFSAWQICGSGSCSATHSRKDLKRRYRSISSPASIALAMLHCDFTPADAFQSQRYLWKSQFLCKKSTCTNFIWLKAKYIGKN